MTKFQKRKETSAVDPVLYKVIDFPSNGKAKMYQTAKQTQRQYIAQILGEDEENITATDPAWARLMKEGVLVRLHIGRWRAKTKLSWSDLGIVLGNEEDKKLRGVIDLGHKKLLPGSILKELDAAETGARRWVEKMSYRTYWGFFLPVTAYEEWKSKNDELKAEYFRLRRDLVSNYDQMKKTVLNDYRIAAHEAYKRLGALHPETLNRFPTESSFVANFLEIIESHLPTALAVQNSFYYTAELQYIPLPSLLAGERAEAERIEAARLLEREQEEAAFRLEREQERAASQLIWTEAQWKEKLMRDMHADVIGKAQQQKEEMIDTFLRDLIVQLRGTVYQATTDVVAAIQKKDGLAPRSIVQLKSLVKQVKNLNFYDDKEIEQMMGPIRSILNQDADDRNVAAIEQQLLNIATVTRVSLMELGELPRSGRNIGLADDIEAKDLNRARRELGLADDIEAAELPRQNRSAESSRRSRMAIAQ
jgi:hypothetical protein